MPTLQPIETIAGALCTREQVKARLGSVGTWSDARIDALIPAVTAAFRARYGRELAPRSQGTRAFAATSRFVDLAASDLVEVTSVTLDGVALTRGADYELLPFGRDPLGAYLSVLLAERPEAAWRPARLEVTGSWGCFASVDEVPADVNAAAIETVLAWLDRSVQQVAGQPGADARAPLPVPTTWDIPASAHRKMQAYARDLGAF